MKNKTRNKYSGLLCLLLLALLPTSCIQDDFAGKDKATLTLYFTTTKNENGTSSDGTTIGPELPNEHMRTLRVIVADEEGNIRYNTKVDVPQDQTQTVINFSELIVDSDGPTTFEVYAIANEEVYATNNEWEGTNINLNNLKDKILNNTILSTLNAGVSEDEYKEGYAVPQTAIQKVTVTPGKNNSATIPLEFVVAKMELNFENTSLIPQTLTNVILTDMDMSETKLFPVENIETIDSDLFWNSIEIPSGEKYSIVKYLYESRTVNSYMLTTAWGNNSLNLTEGGLGDTILRGKKIIINVTLNSQQEASLEFLVIPWSEHDINVPEFQ
ncbi:hypothetical protein [uncultured Bacteroides sp.]|uniref:hypothetical protein n=1 Tax=uncultured Bacteroides sp. TaxID=162156 RepID=UPI002612DB78|nr:hypothetical protein [uncultured Bacteroides sp.]